MSLINELMIKPHRNNSFKTSLKELLSTFAYTLLILFVNYVLVSGLDYLIHLKTDFSFLKAIDRVQQIASNQKNILFFLVIAPILEELVFRLPLRLSRLNLFISISSAYLLFYCLHHAVSVLSIGRGWVKIILFLCLAGLISYSIKEQLFHRIENNYFKAYCCLLTITFGLLHIRNFINLVPEDLILLSPIFVIHQIIIGFSLAYVRLKNGLIWCIALHCLFNLPPTISYFINGANH